MSRSRWEYLRVYYLHSTENYGAASQTWSHAYWLMRTGVPAEHRLAEDVDFDALLGELGTDGWELVTEHTRETVIFGEMHGWKNVGSPVSMMWTFKRPLES